MTHILLLCTLLCYLNLSVVLGIGCFGQFLLLLEESLMALLKTPQVGGLVVRGDDPTVEEADFCVGGLNIVL